MSNFPEKTKRLYQDICRLREGILSGELEEFEKNELANRINSLEGELSQPPRFHVHYEDNAGLVVICADPAALPKLVRTQADRILQQPATAMGQRQAGGGRPHRSCTKRKTA